MHLEKGNLLKDRGKGVKKRGLQFIWYCHCSLLSFFAQMQFQFGMRSFLGTGVRLLLTFHGSIQIKRGA